MSTDLARERWVIDPSYTDEGEIRASFRSISTARQPKNNHLDFAEVVVALDGAFHSEEMMCRRRAMLIAKAPELLAIAERFFAFYELHKSARGGELGRDFEKLRTEIMEGIKP